MSGQCLRLCRTQLIERTIDLDVERIEELVDGDGRARRHPFLSKHRPLLVRQRLAACIGEEPVDHAGDMLQVETDRGESGRTRPEQFGRKIAEQVASFVAGLYQRVGDRLQRTGHSLDRPAKPRLSQSIFVPIHHVVPPASLTPPRLSGSSFLTGSCTDVAPASSARLYVSSTSRT